MRAALLLMPLLILPGCATTTGSVEADAVACSAFEPIRWSLKDTDDTIRQVKEHNSVWKAVCADRHLAKCHEPVRVSEAHKSRRRQFLPLHSIDANKQLDTFVIHGRYGVRRLRRALWQHS
jgi:hypothetical protein